jgi:hypothetical protein
MLAKNLETNKKLNTILNYLEQSNKSTYDKGKIIWIGSNKKIDLLIKKGKEY